MNRVAWLGTLTLPLLLVTSCAPVAVDGTVSLPSAGMDSAARTAARASTSPAPCSNAG